MRETYYVGSYWLGRKEPAEACARRAESFFRLLRSCDPTLTQWFGKASSREEALKLRVEPEFDTFMRMFGERENQGVKGGFRMGFWNGAPQGQACTLSFLCGSSSQVVPNTCVLTPPSEGPAERVLSAPVLAQVLRAMVLAWEPEVGIATSDTHRDEVLKNSTVGTFPGWMMYFARRRGDVPPLPAPVQVEPVQDKGTLIVLTPERFTASNPSHVELAREVGDVLDRAGLLKPLSPWDSGS